MITSCYWLLSGLHIFFCSWNTCTTQSHIAPSISLIDNLLCNKMIHNVGLWLIASSCERLTECGEKNSVWIFEKFTSHYNYIMIHWQCCLFKVIECGCILCFFSPEELSISISVSNCQIQENVVSGTFVFFSSRCRYSALPEHAYICVLLKLR